MLSRCAGWAIMLVCMCVLILGPLGQSAEGVEETPANSSEQYIQRSQSLSVHEHRYIQRKKYKVLQSLHSLGINLTMDSVPHIALLGSGGGQRAALALLGSLDQMEEEGLLETMLYLGGVSGSTWAMASLYSDPAWRQNITRVISTMSGPSVGWDETLAWLRNMEQIDLDFSLTDIWAAGIASIFIKEFDTRRLSEDCLRNASNPYPIYNAIEKACHNENITATWFELTPHEAGFTDLGLFIETSLLGSKFDAGVLQEKRPEMDMVKLQGVLGSALAEIDAVMEEMPEPIRTMYKVHQGFTSMFRGRGFDNTTASSFNDTEMDAYARIVGGQKSNFEEGVEDSSQHDSNVTARSVFPLIRNWEWGTTKNFLYQYQDPEIPSCLQSEDMYLIDAGLSNNIPYPPFLGDRRDIDLIIALEYSAGDMFLTLTEARDYAAKMKKPFPEIDDKVLEEKDWPRDCYVFQGEGKQPTIVYMPLFNRNNCKDAEEYQERMKEFATVQRALDQDKIDFLLSTAKANMKNNKETILREINKAAERRHMRKSAASDL